MKKQNSKDKMKKLYMLLVTLGSISLLLGGAFAWLQLTLTSTKEHRLTAGNLVLVLADTASSGISLQKVVPMLDEVALKQEGYTFTLKNTGTITSEYTIYLDDVLLAAGETRLSDEKLKYNFSRVGGPSTTQLLSEAGMNPDRVLETGTIAPGVTYTYTLKLWLDSNASNESMGKVFRGKIRIEANQVIEQLPSPSVDPTTSPVAFQD